MKRKYISRFFNITSFLCLIFVCGCAPVAGVVKDQETGNVIKSATVSVGSRSTKTNMFGRYAIYGHSGQDLTIDATGYGLYSETIGENKHIDVYMVPK